MLMKLLYRLVCVVLKQAKAPLAFLEIRTNFPTGVFHFLTSDWYWAANEAVEKPSVYVLKLFYAFLRKFRRLCLT